VSQRGLANDLELANEIAERFRAAIDHREPPARAETREKLIEVNLTLDEAEALHDVMEHRRTVVATEYQGILYDMAVTYLVALFEAFLVDSLELVLVAKSEMLRSNRQVSYETALQFADRAELVRFMARRELGEMTYKTFAQQLAYIARQFGIDFERAGVLPGALIEVMARRNLLVHNSGIVNSVYLGHVHDSPHALGQRLVTDDCYWSTTVETVRAAIDAVHSQLVAKFAPPTEPQER
jgi:hypothetical protein